MTDAKDTSLPGGSTFKSQIPDLYRIATGYLGWTPETFWKSTPYEILWAWDAYLHRTGQKRASSNLKAAEVADLKAQIDAALQAEI
jgi:hypothetical protein